MSRTRGANGHIPTDEQRRTVEALAGFGIPQERIMLVIGISKPTLLKAYPDELQRGTASVEANLIGNLLRLAKGSDGTALKAIMFSLQMRFGWRAPQQEYESRPEPIGKKEAQIQNAYTAHEGTRWDELVKRLN